MSVSPSIRYVSIFFERLNIVIVFKLTARAASCNGPVHLFVCLSVAKMQKLDFLKK